MAKHRKDVDFSVPEELVYVGPFTGQITDWVAAQTLAAWRRRPHGYCLFDVAGSEDKIIMYVPSRTGAP
jgi:hypothetical protein